MHLLTLLLSHLYLITKVFPMFHPVTNYMRIKNNAKNVPSFSHLREKKNSQQFSFTIFKNSICLCNHFFFWFSKELYLVLLFVDVYGNVYTGNIAMFPVIEEKKYFIHQCQNLSGLLLSKPEYHLHCHNIILLITKFILHGLDYTWLSLEYTGYTWYFKLIKIALVFRFMISNVKL